MDVNQLLNSDLWFKGPNLLWREEPTKNYDVPNVPSDIPEMKKAVRSCASVSHGYLTQRWTYFSSWSHLQRAVAHCQLYKRKLLHIVKARHDNNLQAPNPTIRVNDICEAEIAIIKSVQQGTFSKEIAALQAGNTNEYVIKKASPLFILDPYLDDQGMLRVGGRLEQADFSIEVKHPIILPRAGHVSLLIVRHYHEITHQGRGITTNAIRQARYWICGIRPLIRSVIYSCVTCRKCRRPLELQKMAPLPEDRVDATPPSTYCGVDCFGPFYVRHKRSDIPRYGVIFTCLMSRAIHLEVADTMDTSSFINALKRFIAIRGPIRQLRCDKGTNFVGAKNELAREYEGNGSEQDQAVSTGSQL